MGVPRFFRTTSERYPHINVDLDSAVAPAIDNLYIDMNGVVHNCARGSSAPGEPDSTRYHTTSAGPRTYADTFLAVFKYLDNLFALVAPRRVVYMAIDGVAPRAKMNQQRSRRFRSAKEREDEHAQKMREDPMYKAANITPFDSNCITPGTQFMAELTQALDYFVHKRVSEDAAWASVEVILSGAEVAGEGEHKIMEYIRAMKLAKRVPADTRHCVYGLDADLIMLGLVTHEPHFVLLREKIDFTTYFKRKSTRRDKSMLDTAVFGEFQLLSVGLLREYLALDVGGGGLSALPFFDIERIVNDFVFIAMLLGNDFLPHLPTIEMADGALGTLLLLYKRLLPRFGGYLSDKGTLIPRRFELFALMMGLLEVELLPASGDGGGGGRGRNGLAGGRGRNKAAAAKSESDMDKLWGFEHSPVAPPPWTDEGLDLELVRVRAKLAANERHVASKRKYYRAKIGFDCGTEGGAAELRALTTSYVEGVCWTLKYYFEGCADWRWFYPFHYAPMASDLVDVAGMMSKVSLTRGTPFKPMEQLLSVLPPSSAWCLPKPFQLLMTHPSSPIRNKYPVEFKADMNGKRNEWEAVVLLPFIDERVLLAAMATVPNSELTPAERARNSHGTGVRFRRRALDADGAAPPAPASTHVQSPFPGRLPDLASLAHTSPLDLPFVAYGVPFATAWSQGTHATGTHPSVADLPTFSPVPHAANLAPVGVNVFGMPGKHESLLVEVGRSPADESEDEFGLLAGLDSDDDGREQVADERSPAVAGAARGGKCATPAHWESVQAAVEAGFGVGKNVWAGYPWRLAAVVQGLSDEKRTVECAELDGGGFTVAERPTKAKHFATEGKTLAASLMDHRAVGVERPKVIFRVCVAVDKDALTGVPKRFATAPVVFPAASVVLMRDEDVGGLSAAITRRRQAGEKVPPDVRAGDVVLFSRRGSPLLGCTARIAPGRPGAEGSSGQLSLSFPIRAAFAMEPAFGHRVVTKARATERWMPGGRAAAAVKLPPPVLGSITGSVRVSVPDAGRLEIDIGLGIKYPSRGLFIPGYAKVDDRGTFLLSEKAVTLVQAYRSSFPHMFSSLVRILSGDEARSGGARVLNAADLFGREGNAREMLSAAASWVAASELALLPLVSGDARVLPKATVAELEREAVIARALRSDAQARGPGSAEKASLVAPRAHLVSGCETIGQYAHMAASGGATPCISPDVSDVRLGDRVVNCRATGPVPFGLRGTVVGIHPAKSSEQVSEEARKGPRTDGKGGALIDVTTLAQGALVEVVFDDGLIGGGDLNGRCSVTRGKAMPPDSLIVLRPSGSNDYYTANHARIAGLVASRPSVDALAAQKEANQRQAKTAVMANAAVHSYAQAAVSPAVAPTGGDTAACA
jgi:5'-3' exoribonuclease 1